MFWDLHQGLLFMTEAYFTFWSAWPHSYIKKRYEMPIHWIHIYIYIYIYINVSIRSSLYISVLPRKIESATVHVQPSNGFPCADTRAAWGHRGNDASSGKTFRIQWQYSVLEDNEGWYIEGFDRVSWRCSRLGYSMKPYIYIYIYVWFHHQIYIYIYLCIKLVCCGRVLW
jgi:hypothetical protein